MHKGEILTKVLKTEFWRENDGENHFKVVTGNTSTVYFRSRTIIMGPGAV